MNIKLLEIRDSGTFIPAFAFHVSPDNESQRYLIRRCGYDIHGAAPSIILGYLNGEKPASADPYFWNNRTMQVAHLFLIEQWDDLRDGDVVDVEYILGLKPTKKESERFTCSHAL